MNGDRIKVLQVLVGGKTFTGVASYLYQQYLHMDRSRVHYDFLFCRENAMELVQDDPIFSDSAFITLNAVKGSARSTDYRKLREGVRQALSRKQYQFIVVNTSIVEVILTCLSAAKAFPGVRLIGHAHNTGIVLKSSSLRSKLAPAVDLVENRIRKKIRKEAAYLFACSREAGRVTFGSEAVDMPKFSVIRNAIDLDSFRPDEDQRKAARAEGKASDREIVYGNIGSLCKRKNQLFLLDAFSRILSSEPEAALWLIGDGEYREKLEQRAKELGIGDRVVFWGQRADVSRLMKGMDCFLFPTLSEGLGIVAIEAQAAGLPTLVSDGVPGDVLLTDSCKMVPLQEGAEAWAEAARAFRRQKPAFADHFAALAEAGYDIRLSAAAMTDFYAGGADKNA